MEKVLTLTYKFVGNGPLSMHNIALSSSLLLLFTTVFEDERFYKALCFCLFSHHMSLMRKV